MVASLLVLGPTVHLAEGGFPVGATHKWAALGKGEVELLRVGREA